jgi:hypothetical protein
MKKKVEKEIGDIWVLYDSFVQWWCLNYAPQEFCFECTTLNSARTGRPQGCEMHEEQAKCWSNSPIWLNRDRVFAVYNPDINAWPKISLKQSRKEKKLRDKTLEKHVPSINVIEVLSAANSTNSFSLLKVQAKITCNDKQWTSENKPGSILK